jgi:uncharacterized membrane protein YhaH (DUF805 family)
MNENGGREDRRQFFWLALVVCIVGALVVVAVAWQIANLSAEVERKQCEELVKFAEKVQPGSHWQCEDGDLVPVEE